MSDPKKTSQEKFDAEFDAFLREENSRMAELYRKLPHPEPDATLDARVRAQARRALLDHDEAATESQPSPRSRARVHRWLPALGAAATLVLVAGLAWRLAPQKATTRENASVAVVADALPSQSPPTSAPAPALKPSTEPSQESARQRASADARAPTPAPASENRQKPRQTIVQETAPAPATSARKAAEEETNVHGAAAPEDAAPALATPADKAKPNAAAPMSLQSAQPPALLEREMAKSAPAPAPPPPPAAVAAPQRDAMENHPVTAQAFSTAAASGGPPVAIEQDPSDPTRYHWSIPGDAATAAPASSGTYPPDPPPPQAWIQIIHSMLNDGHLGAAKQALADLRARYPDYNVPADLRALE